MAEVLLDAQNLSKVFAVRPRGDGLFAKKREVHAIDEVSFHLHPGEVLGVVGESGSGKSTLARAVLGLTPPTGGQVFYKGEEITGFRKSAVQKYRSEIQMVFQDPYASLNPRLTIQSAIAEAVQSCRSRVSQKEAEKIALEQIVQVGLQPDMGRRYPHEFSGGQRQRVGIARSLATGAKLLFCDEVVSALDVSVQAQILNLFTTLKKQLELTYVFIGHDLAVIKYISDRILVLYLGRVMEVASAADLFAKQMHPYTRALISALPEPKVVTEAAPKIVLSGELPSPLNLPKGCRFQTRCYRAQEICQEKEPELTAIGPDHYLRCHFPHKEGEA